MDYLYNFKAFIRCDWIDQNVTVDIYGVGLWEDRVLILSCCVYQLKMVLLSIYCDHFSKCVFYCWVIGVNKLAFHKLNCQGRLSYGSVPEDGDFSWFRLRHISFWLSHLVLGVYRNLQLEWHPNSRGVEIRHTASRWQQESLFFVLIMMNFTPTAWNKNVISGHIRKHGVSIDLQ